MADEERVQPTERDYKAHLLDKLYSDDKTREPLLNLIKEHAPNVRIPEIDSRRRVEEALKPALDRVQEAENRLTKREEEFRQRQERQDLVNAGIARPSDFEAITKFQAERKIGEFKDAAELYAMNERAAAPRSLPVTPMALPGNELLFKNPIRFAREEAAKVLNEFRNRR